MRPPTFGARADLEVFAYEPPESAIEHRARGATSTVSEAIVPAPTGEVTLIFRTPPCMAAAPKTTTSATTETTPATLTTLQILLRVGDAVNSTRGGGTLVSARSR
jgi:hypothetical protein